MINKKKQIMTTTSDTIWLNFQKTTDILNDVFFSELYYQSYNTFNKITDVLEQDHSKNYEKLKDWTYKIKINNTFLDIKFSDKEKVIQVINYSFQLLGKLKNYEKNEKLYMKERGFLNDIYNLKENKVLFDIKIKTYLLDNSLISKEDFEKIFWKENFWKNMKKYMKFLEKVR